MKRYLRFGEIPKNGNSINFLKLTFDQQEDFNFNIKTGDYERAISCVPSDAYEKGTSVFEMDNNGMPVLSNLHLVTSLLSRIDYPVYEVSGEIVGTGNDLDPIISDIQIIKRRRMDKKKLIDHVLYTMISNFRFVEYTESNNNERNQIFKFCKEYKINKNTGEKVNAWDIVSGNEWVQMPPNTEYHFNGWVFSDPVDGFCAKRTIK